MDKLKVKVLNHESGDLVDEDDEFIFNYTTEDSDKFISLTMPVREKGYVHNRLHPIFEMHLPEGYLLSIIKKHFSKLIKTDDFGLLKVMSPSIKSRVTYERDVVVKNENLTLDELLHPKNDKLFDELVSRFALTSALSGVQPKVLVEDYIVKSWGEEYLELALNEYYCMKVVQNANIPVPEFFISDDEKLFIMKRFDMIDNDEYLGFEDMCVLQAKQRDDKYDGTYEQIAKTIKIFVASKYKKSSLVNFYKMVIVNYLVQNGDAHLKNFGLLYSCEDDIRLAPAYDVVSTTVYIKNDIPALYLLGSKKWWDKKYLMKFGVDSCNLTLKEAGLYFEECISSLDNTIKEIENRLVKEEDENKQEILKKLLEKFKMKDKINAR